MLLDEAPAAISGVNGQWRDPRFEPPRGLWAGLQFELWVRSASLLRKSIEDIGQQAPSTAGCTAIFKLRATPRKK
jgi:hypothetical protein